MTICISDIGTYLPPWTEAGSRLPGDDEDAVTMAVEAGTAAIGDRDRSAVERVVLVTRGLPLLEGGNGAALLAGLGLSPTVETVERIGGAPAALDALLSASPGTLVIGVDLEPAGAAAALTAETGLQLGAVGRANRSLPVTARSADGLVHSYEDPRLLRERGWLASLRAAVPGGRPGAVVGVAPGQAAKLGSGAPLTPPTLGASAPIFALAELTARSGSESTILAAAEQAALTAATVTAESTVASVTRVEPAARPVPPKRRSPGPDIPVSLAAYDRAFESKVRWEAARCGGCGTLAFPPRYRCRHCGSENSWSRAPLPRRAEVYTATSVHVAVPGMATPYDLVIVQLADADVRVLARTTAAAPGTVSIGDTGRMCLRRVAVRSGVPDYGYAFWPDEVNDHDEKGASR